MLYKNQTKIGRKKGNKFRDISEEILTVEMAEGTRLRDLSEHLKAVEEKMQTLTYDCNQLLDSKFQHFELEYNRKLGVMVQQLDELQKEGQQRYEAQQLESTRRHEQLMKLFNTQSSVGKTHSSSSPPLEESKITYEYLSSNGNNSRSVTMEDKGKGILPNPQFGFENNQGNLGHRNPSYVPHPRLDYPTFEGEEPR